MVRKNVPRRSWGELFEELSLAYEGWLVSVESIGEPEPDEALELHESTLDAFDFEVDEGQATVSVSFTDNRPIRIDDVVRVFEDEAEEQGGTILEVEARSRTTVRLWLRMPPSTEREDLAMPHLKEERAEPPPAEEDLEEDSSP